MSGIESNKDQFKKLEANPNEEPFVMLNLLKFKKEGGRDSYFRLSRNPVPYVEGVGAKVLYFGKANELLQGTEDWEYLDACSVSVTQGVS